MKNQSWPVGEKGLKAVPVEIEEAIEYAEKVIIHGSKCSNGMVRVRPERKPKELNLKTSYVVIQNFNDSQIKLLELPLDVLHLNPVNFMVVSDVLYFWTDGNSEVRSLVYTGPLTVRVELALRMLIVFVRQLNN